MYRSSRNIHEFKGSAPLLDTEIAVARERLSQLVTAEQQGAQTAPAADHDADLCVICIDDQQTHVLIPCGHKCVCGVCAERRVGEPCPLCRTVCTFATRVY